MDARRGVVRGVKRVVLASLALALSSFTAGHDETPRHTLSFGVVPQQSPVELARLWSPFLEYLEAKTGLSLQLETAKDVATFEQRLTSGRYDIAYSNPLNYAQIHHPRSGYRAFAREQEHKLVGLLVVRKDSTHQYLSDLVGADLAFPAETATAASVMPRAHLDSQGIAFTPHYVGSHDSVYLSVARGMYVGGGGVARTLEMQPAALREQLRVLWRTPAYPPHPFAAHPRVPAEAVRRLQAAMLAMDRDPAAQAILKALAFTRIGAARDADYDALRALGVQPPGF